MDRDGSSPIQGTELVEQEEESPLKIAVVGPCATGKSTLVAALKTAGFEARHVAQEHSYVPNMWQVISQPDFLIFLDADYDTLRRRRPNTDFQPPHLAEQRRRLAHARAHCHLYIDTTALSPGEVRDRVLSFLANWPS